MQKKLRLHSAERKFVDVRTGNLDETRSDNLFNGFEQQDFAAYVSEHLSVVQQQWAMNYKSNHFTTRSASIMPPIK